MNVLCFMRNTFYFDNDRMRIDLDKFVGEGFHLRTKFIVVGAGIATNKHRNNPF